MIDDVKRLAGPFTGEGQATFPFNFKIFQKEDVYVALAPDNASSETILTLDTDYTVSMNSDQDATPGGSVTLTTPLKGTQRLAIGSAIPYTQEMQLTNYGRFPPEIINTEMDRQVVQIQQLAEQLGRAVIVPPTSDKTPQQVSEEIMKAHDETLVARDQAQSAQAAAEEAQRGAEAARDESQSILESVKTEGAAQVAAIKKEGGTQVQAVKDAGAQAVSTVNSTRDSAIEAVKAEGDKQVARVTTEGGTQIEAIKAASAKEQEAIKKAGADRVNEVNAALETKADEQIGRVAAEGDKQVKRVTDEGTKQVAAATAQADRAQGEADEAQVAAQAAKESEEGARESAARAADSARAAADSEQSAATSAADADKDRIEAQRAAEEAKQAATKAAFAIHVFPTELAEHTSQYPVASLSPDVSVKVGDHVIDSRGDVYEVAAVDGGMFSTGDKEASLRGPQGVQGVRGPQGDRGERGEAGPQGDRGATGPAGEQGPVGATGAQGPKGDQGLQGPKGDQGATGATGAPGPAGAVGPTGARGYSTRVFSQVLKANTTANWVDGFLSPATDVQVADLVVDQAGAVFQITGIGWINKATELLEGAEPRERIKVFGVGNPVGNIKGAQGEAGPQGPAGPQGEAGPQGPKGEPGDITTALNVNFMQFRVDTSGCLVINHTGTMDAEYAIDGSDLTMTYGE